MYIDAHCHIERETYGDRLDEVIARAFDAGVVNMVVVGATRVAQGAHEAVTLAERLDAIYATVGIHPHDAAAATPEDFAAVEAYLGHPKVVALGEIGLDYYYDHAPPRLQREVFERLLRQAREHNIPAMLHVRDAHADCLAILDAVGLPERGAVVHCFTGGPEEAAAYLARGLYLSIPGVVTFQGKSVDPLREAVRAAPLDRLLIETDSPYLAPVLHRGKQNEPAFVVHVAEAIGKLRGLSGEDIGRVTTQNASRFFDLNADQPVALAYPIRDSLYVNLTSRCTLGCTFCPKVQRHDWWVRGHWLRLRRDPAVDDVLAAVRAELARRPALCELVFVGLGEPTLRLDALLQIARAVRSEFPGRLRLRVDTDGLGNLVHGRNIAPELASVLDAASVSLNAADAATYARLCPSKYGEAAYPAVKAFILAAKAAGLAITASAVGVPELDLDACRRVAVDELGVEFRHRVYQEYG